MLQQCQAERCFWQHQLDALQTDQGALSNWGDLMGAVSRQLDEAPSSVCSYLGGLRQQMLHLSAFYTLHAQPDRAAAKQDTDLSGCACSV